MAITRGDRLLWRLLRERELIPPRPVVLEIGRANWYGDITGPEARADREQLGEGMELPAGLVNVWQAADWYYDVMLRRPRRTAIDLDPAAELAGGPVRVLALDLNQPLPAWLRAGAFDLVLNTGTTEHVFDQRQAWESIHAATLPGGIMLHGIPLWGWLDHGFYNYNPTTIADLAAENGYEVLCWLIHELKTGWYAEVAAPADFAAHQCRAAHHSAMMYVALRRTHGGAFRVPMQGVYSARATTQQTRAWHENR